MALAGLLLVFVGFIFAKAEAAHVKARADLLRNTARAGAIPFLLAMGCAWCGVNYIQGDIAAFELTIWLFRFALIATVWYAFVALFMYL